uniref:Uncharacterized protein n=1 Tax=Micrurus surinamensis TaxID=129470 RepID=A0A2D4NN56_MICSU
MPRILERLAVFYVLYICNSKDPPLGMTLNSFKFSTCIANSPDYTALIVSYYGGGDNASMLLHSRQHPVVDIGIDQTQLFYDKAYEVSCSKFQCCNEGISQYPQLDAFCVLYSHLSLLPKFRLDVPLLKESCLHKKAVLCLVSCQSEAMPSKTSL